MEQLYDNQSKNHKFLVNIKDYKIIKQVETNDYGSIYIAQNIETSEELSAKVINSNGKGSNGRQSINSEIALLIRCQHPTLIRFIGYSIIDFDDQKNLTIFTELTKNGSLEDLLQKVQGGQTVEFYDNTARQIILVGIARGMMYLHLHQVIHKHLRPKNILLDQNLQPYITDFAYSFGQTQTILNSVYTAPEILRGKPYSGKADVYSFGIIMYEIITNLVPYPDLHNGKLTPIQLAKKVINDNYRPKIPKPVKKSFQKLIEKCWSKDPKERPTFDEIFKKLAFNIENIYNEEDSEMSTEESSNRYFLDDVVSIDVMSYAETIGSPLASSNKEIEAKFGQLEAKLENLINPLKVENSQLREANEKMQKEIDSLRKENEEMKARMSEIEKKIGQHKVEEPKSVITHIPEEPEAVTVDNFNNLSLKDQNSFILSVNSKGQNEKVNSFFTDVKSLLLYLMKLNVKESATYFQIGTQNQKDSLAELKTKPPIHILANSTEVLMKNDSFNSSDFTRILDNFNDVSFDLKYPSSTFKNDYKTILKLKKTKGNSIKIALFITGIVQTDQAFNDDSNINTVKIDGKGSKIVTTIREYSFSGCTNMTSIIIPTTVKVIGSYAFNGCTSLPTIVIPESINEIKEGTFTKCSSLTQIFIPSSVSMIGSYAFKGCSTLKEIKIPESVCMIGDGAFEECTSLVTFCFPKSITKIETSMFKKCSKLENVIIPPSVTKIGRGAFYRCTALQQISLPSSITDIMQYAFAECTKLAKITLPENVAEIRGKTFEGCTALHHVRIPFSVTSIAKSAFGGCKALKKISIPSSVSVIEEGAFPPDTETVSKVLA